MKLQHQKPTHSPIPERYSVTLKGNAVMLTLLVMLSMFFGGSDNIRPDFTPTDIIFITTDNGPNPLQ